MAQKASTLVVDPINLGTESLVYEKAWFEETISMVVEWAKVRIPISAETIGATALGFLIGVCYMKYSTHNARPTKHMPSKSQGLEENPQLETDSEEKELASKRRPECTSVPLAPEAEGKPDTEEMSVSTAPRRPSRGNPSSDRPSVRKSGLVGVTVPVEACTLRGNQASTVDRGHALVTNAIHRLAEEGNHAKPARLTSSIPASPAGSNASSRNGSPLQGRDFDISGF